MFFAESLFRLYKTYNNLYCVELQQTTFNDFFTSYNYDQLFNY